MCFKCDKCDKCDNLFRINDLQRSKLPDFKKKILGIDFFKNWRELYKLAVCGAPAAPSLDGTQIGWSIYI